jgi:hypothetical protein
MRHSFHSAPFLTVYRLSCTHISCCVGFQAVAHAVSGADVARGNGDGGKRAYGNRKPKRGHRRNVSFDFDREAKAQAAAHVHTNAAASAAATAVASVSLSLGGSELSDELLSIIQGKDDPEAATIFL